MNFDLLEEEFVCDWKFVKEIVLVFVPVAATIIFSKLFLNSWQTRKEKFELRKKILNEFDKTFPYIINRLYNLSFKVNAKYVKTEINLKTNEETKVVTIPENEDEKPYNVFKDEIEELKNSFHDVNQSTASLRSSMIIYFKDDSTIKEKIKELQDISNLLYHLFLKMIYSNAENYEKCEEKFGTAFSDSFELQNNCRKLLADEKLKDPKI